MIENNGMNESGLMISKEEKEALQIRELMYTKALSAEYDILYYIDVAAQKNIFLAGDDNTKRFFRMVSAPSEDMIYKNFYKYYVDSVVYEEDREKVKNVINGNYIRQCLKEKTSIKVVYRVKRNLVDYVYTEMSVIKAEVKNDEVTAALIAFKIVDDVVRKDIETQKALEKEKNNLQMLHDIMHSVRWSVKIDDDEEIESLDWTPGMRQFLGYDPDEEFSAEKESWTERIHPDDLDKIIEEINNAIHDRTGNKQYEAEYRVKNKDGEYIWCRVAGRVIRDEHGKPEQVLGAIQNITVEKNALEERDRLEKQRENDLKNAELRADALSFIVEHECNPEEFLEFFGSRILELSGCDLVIYRGVDKSKVVIKTHGINDESTICCENCPFSDVYEDTVFADDIVTMNDCTEGFNGGKVPSDCTAKSMLIQRVYANGHLIGMMSIYYIKEKHYFSDDEINTHKTLANLLGLGLERIEAKKIREEHIRLQREVCEQRDVFVEFQDIIHSGVWTVDFYREGRSLPRAKSAVWSDEFRRLLGYENEEDFPNVIESWRDRLYPDDMTRAIGDCYSAYEKGLYDSHFRMIQKNNSIHWYHAKGRIHVNEDGGGTIFGTLTDETSEHEAKEFGDIASALSESYESLYYINIADNSYKVFESKGDLSEQKIRYLGTDFFYESLENSKMLVCPEDFNYVNRFLDKGRMLKGLANGKVDSAVYRLVINGEYKYYRMRATLAKDDEHIILVVENVDDEQQTLNEINRERNERLRTIETLAETYISMYIVDPYSEKVTIVKKAPFIDYEALKLSERKFSEVLEDWAKRVIHPDDLEVVKEVANVSNLRLQLLTGGKIIQQFRTIDENEPTYQEIRLAPISNSEKNGMIIVAFLDRTEFALQQIRQQNELEEALVKARAASDAKTNFLFNMSHDIRTPMNAVTGYTTLAKRHIEQPELVEDYLNKIELAGHNLLSLVNQVLEMARIESGKVTLEQTQINIVEKVNAMLTVVSANANIHGVNITGNVSEIKNADVITDDSRLNQVITNILGNAIKYTPEGGKITFTAMQKGLVREGYGRYVFITEDTGIGMSEEFLSHIFEEFSREHNTTVSGIQGTGLGMSIVKKIVDLMEGTVEIQSKLGKGTKVTIELPMKIVSKANNIENEKEDFAADFKGKKLLLVEDNEMNREIAADILGEVGFIVDMAEDGDIAVEKVNNSSPGEYFAVLMDVQMPRMNGYEATKMIRSLPDKNLSDVPIIAMTANAFIEDRQNALAAGMNDHLAKPISIPKLMETLSKYV